MGDLLVSPTWQAHRRFRPQPVQGAGRQRDARHSRHPEQHGPLTEAPATSRTSIATDIASTDTPTRANQSVIVGTRLRAQVEPWRRPTAVTSTAGDDPAGRQAQQTPGEPGVPSGHLATAPLLSS